MRLRTCRNARIFWQFYNVKLSKLANLFALMNLLRIYGSLNCVIPVNCMLLISSNSNEEKKRLRVRTHAFVLLVWGD